MNIKLIVKIPSKNFVDFHLQTSKGMMIATLYKTGGIYMSIIGKNPKNALTSLKTDEVTSYINGLGEVFCE